VTGPLKVTPPLAPLFFSTPETRRYARLYRSCQGLKLRRADMRVCTGIQGVWNWDAPWSASLPGGSGKESISAWFYQCPGFARNIWPLWSFFLLACYFQSRRDCMFITY